MAEAASEPVHEGNYVQIASKLLVPTPVSAFAFGPFGTLITPMPDGAPDPAVDRALDLSGGSTRF